MTREPTATRPRRVLSTILLLIATAIITGLVAALAPSPTMATQRLHHWHHRTPVGFTIAGLQHNYLDAGSLQIIEGQIATAKNTYHANTIRLQITQNRLVGANGHRYNPAYMAQVQEVTDYGLSLGLTMVLNAQTEYSPGYPQGSGFADRATMAFWRAMMPVYGNRPRVHFDLFNEPRHQNWTEWQHTTQPVVSMIRRSHARNWIWLEGPKYASTLEGMPHLHGGRLIYTFHHPGSPWAGQAEHNIPTWDKSFGYLAKTGHPVVDGEYVNDAKTYHMARRDVRAYLHYAKDNHIGMLVFGLEAHKLIERYQAA